MLPFNFKQRKILVWLLDNYVLARGPALFFYLIQFSLVDKCRVAVLLIQGLKVEIPVVWTK